MPPQSFNKVFDWQDVFIFCLFEGTGLSNQTDGRCNGQEGLSNGRNLDLNASLEEACPDPCSKSTNNDDDVKLAALLEVWVNFPGGSILNPFFPIFFAI